MRPDHKGSHAQTEELIQPYKHREPGETPKLLDKRPLWEERRRDVGGSKGISSEGGGQEKKGLVITT